MTAHLRASLVLSLASLAASVPGSAQAQTAVSVAAQIGDFHVAVSNYYRVPEREVIVIRERRIHDDDLPVVLFIARHAGVPPMRIVDLRLRGLSWWDISVRFGLGPEVYYVPVRVAPGPPYGKAYGYYKKPRNQWRTIRLADDDVVNMVHLKFLSEHYRIPPERVMELRRDRGSFGRVHQEVSRGRGEGGPERRSMADDRDSGKHAEPEARRASNDREGGRGNGQKDGNGRGRGKN